MTIIDEIKKGNIPDVVNIISKDENISVEKLVELIEKGKVVIPKNKNRDLKKPVGIGKHLRTKVNANIGTSEDIQSIKEEIKKLLVAEKAGTDTIMDLSTGGNLKKIRKEIIKISKIPLGTVPIYEAALKSRQKQKSIVSMKVDEIFNVIESQAKDGVDFMTIHSGVNEKILNTLKTKKRVAGVVSRGGSFILAWMLHNEKENPLYQYFDRVLEICRKYDVTLSLGDGLRPGSIEDATDLSQIQELINLGELVKEAKKENVQVMVEGPGHIPIDQIRLNVELQKRICDEAPFYVLGPLVTDIAPGYDHITSAIGGALAASYGADYLCYVTPREHIGLPDEEDVREGVITARIAAHAADIAKGVKSSKKWDLEISKARKNLEWEKQINLSINPEKMRKMWKERKTKDEDSCSMCGEFCALKILSDNFKLDFPIKC